jgi:hypothetical protein
MKFKKDQPFLCPRCGETEIPLEVDAKPPHYKKLVCPDCGYCHGFVAKPENEKKLEHRPSGQPNVSQLMEMKGISHCEMCLRRKDQLGKGFFEVHHVSNDPSDNSPENLQLLCKMCHQLVHYLRVYVNDHLKGFFDGVQNDDAR